MKRVLHPSGLTEVITETAQEEHESMMRYSRVKSYPSANYRSQVMKGKAKQSPPRSKEE